MKRKPDFYMINGTIVCGYWRGSRMFAFSRKYADREYLTLFHCAIEDLEKKPLSQLCKKYLNENEKTWLSQLIDGILKGRIKGPWSERLGSPQSQRKEIPEINELVAQIFDPELERRKREGIPYKFNELWQWAYEEAKERQEHLRNSTI